MRNNFDGNLDKKKVLTDKDVAEFLAVTIPIVKNLAKEGKIPHFWVNRSLRFHADALEKWIHEGGTGTPSWKNNLQGYKKMQHNKLITAESSTLNRK